MSERNFVLLYYFLNENVILTEIKKKDYSGEDHSQKFQWLKINTSTREVEQLVFKSMKTEVVNENEINVRTFEDGELRFDNFFAKFQLREEGHILMKSELDQVPEIFLNLIDNFLKKTA